jgi:hypothetical protein
VSFKGRVVSRACDRAGASVTLPAQAQKTKLTVYSLENDQLGPFKAAIEAVPEVEIAGA